jgi:hypothetical protein
MRPTRGNNQPPSPELSLAIPPTLPDFASHEHQDPSPAPGGSPSRACPVRVAPAPGGRARPAGPRTCRAPRGRRYRRGLRSSPPIVGRRPSLRPPRLTASPYRSGDFIWCAFPERENPARPGPRHLAYALIVYNATATMSGSIIAAYTTSRPWSDGIAQPRGLFRFDRQEAAALGQARAFVLDTRRLAYVPINARWFPHLDRPDRGVQGRAPQHLRQRIWREAEELITRRTELIERLGPLWRQ